MVARPQFEPTASRIAAVRAAAIMAAVDLPSEARSDIAQDILVDLWRAFPTFDADRGGWRTFAEHVARNRVSSIVRRQRAARRSGLEQSLEGLTIDPVALDQRLDLRVDVNRVVARLPALDRTVALMLIDHSASEAGRLLGVSRATVYRAVERIRSALRQAGLESRFSTGKADLRGSCRFRPSRANR